MADRPSRPFRKISDLSPRDLLPLAAFGLAFILLVLNALLVEETRSAQLRFENLGNASRELLREIENVTRSLVQAESAVRGYVLTQDTSFSLSSVAARADVSASLERITAYDLSVGERSLLDTLRARVARRTELFDRTITLRRSGLGEASDLLQTGEPSRVMAEVLDAATGIGSSVRFRLQAQAAREEEQVALLLLLGRAGNVAAIVIALAAIAALAADMRRRNRAESNLRTTQEDLVRSNQDLEQFASVASHDLQAPLRSVRGFVGLLRDRHAASMSAEAKDYVRYIDAGVHRMQSLIEDILAYARVGSGTPVMTAVDLRIVLDDIRRDLTPQLSDRSGRIEIGHMPTVFASESQIRQVFQNLIGNGLKFCKDRAPVVEVSAEAAGAEWLFRVRDNGIGIDPEYQPRLFQIFHRLHSVAEYPGNGMGLSICKRIVEKHRGRIWMQSALGEGTTILFTLPRRGDDRSDIADAAQTRSGVRAVPDEERT